MLGTYDLSEKKDVLSANQKQAAVDVSVEILNEEPLNGIL